MDQLAKLVQANVEKEDTAVEEKFPKINNFVGMIARCELYCN